MFVEDPAYTSLQLSDSTIVFNAKDTDTKPQCIVLLNLSQRSLPLQA
jgi:hypothetical protein